MSPSRSMAHGSTSTYRRSGVGRGVVSASGTELASSSAVLRLTAFLDAIRRAPPATCFPAHAPARLRLQARQRRQGHPRLAGVAGTPEHPTYRALHRDEPDAVQEFLAEGGLIILLTHFRKGIIIVSAK